MSLTNVLILVLIFCLVLIILGKSEGRRGELRLHSGLQQSGRYFSGGREEPRQGTVSTFSTYREKLTQPCGYRPTVGKRSAQLQHKRGFWQTLMEIVTGQHQQNIFSRIVSDTLHSKSLEAGPRERTKREALEQSSRTLELRNLLTGIQFIITEHLLLQVTHNVRAQHSVYDGFDIAVELHMWRSEARHTHRYPTI